MWGNVVITTCGHFILAIRKKEIKKRKKKRKEIYVCGKNTSFFFLKKSRSDISA